MDLGCQFVSSKLPQIIEGKKVFKDEVVFLSYYNQNVSHLYKWLPENDFRNVGSIFDSSKVVTLSLVANTTVYFMDICPQRYMPTGVYMFKLSFKGNLPTICTVNIKLRYESTSTVFFTSPGESCEINTDHYSPAIEVVRFNNPYTSVDYDDSRVSNPLWADNGIIHVDMDIRAKVNVNIDLIKVTIIRLA